MNINYDRVADALYLRFSQKEVTKTVPLEGNLVADFDAAGDIVGLEVLDASSFEDLQESLSKNIPNGIPVNIIQATPAAA